MADKEAGKDAEPIVLSAQAARQGDIVLRRRWQRIVFIAGLAATVLLAAGLWFLAVR
jgi:hypothetical protein